MNGKLILDAAVLLFFVCIGVAHVVWPDRYLERSGVCRGGQALNGANRLAMRLLGAMFAGGSGYVLYELLRDILRKS